MMTISKPGHAYLPLALSLALAAGCGDRSAGTDEDGGGSVDKDGGGIVYTESGVPTASNQTCAKAERIALKNGSAAVSGATTLAQNEYGTSINCGSSSTIMRGPQVYYKVSLKKGTTYKVGVTAQFSGARFYIFTGCGATKINADCGSGGLTGDVSASIFTGKTGALFFKPRVDGDYLIAVDSYSPSTYAAGAFTLTIDEFTAPDNGTCAKAKALALSGGKVSVSGTTQGVANEFGTGIYCGEKYYTMTGPQVYYRLDLKAGNAYLMTLTVDYSYARMYVFGTTCTESAINKDCGSSGQSGVLSGAIYSSKPGQMMFSPKTSGTYTVAVDATSSSGEGSFTLAVEESKAPENGTCAKAQPAALAGGKVSLKGTTLGMANEFAGQITCSSTMASDGPQAYYKLTLGAGKTYKFDLNASFSARLYVFGASCDPTQIDKDCSSKGLTGDFTYAYSTTSYPLYFRAAKGGTYHVAVDSTSDSYAGAYTLEISEFTPAANGQCAAAKAVTLSGGKATVTGDTTGVTNEFGTAVNCGDYKSIVYGNQVYYRVKMTAGKTYTLSFTPDYSMARVYVFGTTCDANAINTDCGSKGQTGDVSGYTVKGKATTLTFKPQKTADYTIAVDGTSTTYFGSFSLDISES